MISSCIQKQNIRLTVVVLLHKPYLYKRMALSVKELFDWRNTKDALRSLEEALKCQKCKKITEKPECFDICGHFFCQECIKQMKGPCSVCGAPVRTTEISPDQLVANLVAGWTKICDFVGYEKKISANTELPFTEAQIEDKKEEKPKKVSKRSVENTAEEHRKKSLDACPVKKSVTNKTPAKDLNKRNAKGETPLHVACIKGKTDEVRRLLEEEANPNTKDNAGWTPLHEAVNHGYVEIAELLLKHGAMVNVPGGGNETPLHDAVLNGRLESVKLLIRYGANLEARNANGKTPRDYAQTEEMLMALQEMAAEKPAANTNIELRTPTRSNEKPVILGHALDSEQFSQLSTLARRLKLKVANSYTSEVTHVIVQTDDANVCAASFVTLNAILQGKWIVNTTWLALSLEMGKLVDPEVFEVKGTTNFPNSDAPKRGRINAAKQLPGLLNGCHMYLPGVGITYKLGNVDLSKADLMTLIRNADGVVLTREPDPEAIPPEECTVPYHAPLNSVLAKCSHFIVYKTGKEEPQLKYNMSHVKSLSNHWLLECMETFCIRDPIIQES